MDQIQSLVVGCSHRPGGGDFGLFNFGVCDGVRKAARGESEGWR